MCAATFSPDDERFVAELDEKAQCHMEWTRRLLRCAVLREPPGDDVLSADAYDRCHLGTWLQLNRDRLEQLDMMTLHRLHDNHRRMHGAARSLCLLVLGGEAGDAQALAEFERAQAGVVAELAYLKTACLQRSARLDALTGLPLRYGMEEEFARCRAQAQRHGEAFVAVMIDIDHFKRINDRLGHATGDLALRHVAALLREHCRSGEPVFRFGGEEFLAMLQAADRDAAQHAAGRILGALRETPLQLAEGRRLKLTASAGLAAVGAAESMAEAIARADRALYVAKAAGRDAWRWADAAA